MNEMQDTVNLETTSPDTATADNFDSSNFFESLDAEVNAAIMDEDSPFPVDAPSQEAQTTSQENLGNSGNSKQEHNWEKRYSDSSSEAQRLNSRLKELEPYSPILDALKEDPNLVKHVRGYYEGGGSTPKSMKEELGLDEDFIFDYDEAISDPSSDSANVFNNTVDKVVQRRLSEFAGKQQEESKRISDEASFRQRHDISDDEFGQVVDFAKSRNLSMDDIYYLYNRENRDRAIADNTRKEVVQQMKNVRQKPASMSTAGSEQVETSPDDMVFNAISQAGGAEDLLRGTS